MRSLADIAEDHHVRQFVGRAEELAFLAAVVDAERPDPPLVFIHGPGGVGKTSLVEATRRIAGAERRWVWVDAARIDPTPPEVANALAAVTEPEAGGGAVVVIDGFERLVHLERWFTETVIPGFPDGTAVLITSRRPPGPAWVTSPLIRPLLHSLPLRNLPADDTRRLLGQLGVGGADADSIIAATHGHPLAFLPVRRMRDNTRRRCVPPSGGLLAGSGAFGSARCGSRRHRTPPTAPAPPHPDAPPGSGAATTPPPTATPRAATPHASVCLSRHGPPPDNAHHSALAPEPVAPQAGLPAPAPSPVARVCQDADWQGRVPPEWARREARAPSGRRPHRSAPMR